MRLGSSRPRASTGSDYMRGFALHLKDGVSRRSGRFDPGNLLGGRRAFLCRRGRAGDEALSEIACLRAGTPDSVRVAPETTEQREFVRRWGDQASLAGPNKANDTREPCRGSTYGAPSSGATISCFTIASRFSP